MTEVPVVSLVTHVPVLTGVPVVSVMTEVPVVSLVTHVPVLTGVPVVSKRCL